MVVLGRAPGGDAEQGVAVGDRQSLGSGPVKPGPGENPGDQGDLGFVEPAVGEPVPAVACVTGVRPPLGRRLVGKWCVVAAAPVTQTT